MFAHEPCLDRYNRVVRVGLPNLTTTRSANISQRLVHALLVKNNFEFSGSGWDILEMIINRCKDDYDVMVAGGYKFLGFGVLHVVNTAGSGYLMKSLHPSANAPLAPKSPSCLHIHTQRVCVCVGNKTGVGDRLCPPPLVSQLPARLASVEMCGGTAMYNMAAFSRLIFFSTTRAEDLFICNPCRRCLFHPVKHGKYLNNPGPFLFLVFFRSSSEALTTASLL